MHSLAAALLLSAAALVSGQGMFFKSEAVKGYGYNEPEKVLGPYYIPDGQCSGVVHNLTLACEFVSVVRMTAVDAQAFPAVSIDSLLQRAAVRRRAGPRGCRGRMAVHVAVGCGAARRAARSPPAASVRLARLAQWPPLPQSRRLPPMSPPPFTAADN